MWLCLSNAFLSIVHKDCAEDEVLVRARRRGDIERVFGRDTKVTRYTKSDYLYRAVVKRTRLTAVLAAEVERITYPNFKNTVAPGPLHVAYNEIWSVMADLQPLPPYSGGR